LTRRSTASAFQTIAGRRHPGVGTVGRPSSPMRASDLVVDTAWWMVGSRFMRSACPLGGATRWGGALSVSSPSSPLLENFPGRGTIILMEAVFTWSASRNTRGRWLRPARSAGRAYAWGARWCKRRMAQPYTQSAWMPTTSPPLPSASIAARRSQRRPISQAR
jgi:hypothetical protein